MRAHERRGIPRHEIQLRFNQNRRSDDIVEFISIQHWIRRERRDVQWGRNKVMRELVGPPEFDGPVYTGQHYVGEIMCGRIYNGVTAINYACVRGMHDACFLEYVDRIRRAVVHLRRCSAPRLPDAALAKALTQ